MQYKLIVMLLHFVFVHICTCLYVHVACVNMHTDVKVVYSKLLVLKIKAKNLEPRLPASRSKSSVDCWVASTVTESAAVAALGPTRCRFCESKEDNGRLCNSSLQDCWNLASTT